MTCFYLFYPRVVMIITQDAGCLISALCGTLDGKMQWSSEVCWDREGWVGRPSWFFPIQCSVTKPKLEGQIIIWFLFVQWILASITVGWYRESDQNTSFLTSSRLAHLNVISKARLINAVYNSAYANVLFLMLVHLNKSHISGNKTEDISCELVAPKPEKNL